MHTESELYRILYIPVLVRVYCWLHKACFPKYIFQIPWSYNQTVFHNVCELRNCKWWEPVKTRNKRISRFSFHKKQQLVSQSTWQVSFLACNWKRFFYASIFIILLQTKSLTFPGRDLSDCHQMDQVSTSYTGICDKLNSFNLSLLLSIVASTLHIVHKVFFKGIRTLPLDVDHLALNLDAWFLWPSWKPCKKEDLLLLAKGCQFVVKLYFWGM